MTAPLSLQAIKEAAAAATPGEWELWVDVSWPSEEVVACVKAGDDPDAYWWIVTDAHEPNNADATFIAAANPSTVSRLVAALEVAHEALREVAHDRDGMGNPISTAAAALARMEAKILFDPEEVR